MHIQRICLAFSVLMLGQLPALAADPKMHQGPVTSMDQALSILGLSPITCTPKKGLFGGLDHFSCLAQAGKALEKAMQTAVVPGDTSSIAGRSSMAWCFEPTKAPYWKNVDGDRKKTHKEAVKNATKSLKKTQLTSSWEILREVTAGDVYFVNGCGTKLISTRHELDSKAMGFGADSTAPCSGISDTKKKAKSRYSSRNRKPTKYKVSKTEPQTLRTLKTKTQKCHEASLLINARYAALEYLLNPSKLNRQSVKANWWQIKEGPDRVYTTQTSHTVLSALPAHIQKKLRALPPGTRAQLAKQYTKKYQKKAAPTSNKIGEQLQTQYQAHSDAAAKEIKKHLEKMVKDVKAYAGGCQAVDAATFKPTGEDGELDYSPAYNGARDCAYLIKQLTESKATVAKELLTLPGAISTAIANGSAPSSADRLVQLAPPMHATALAETKALLNNIENDLATPETTAMLQLNQESATQKGQALLILCEEENVTACFEKLESDAGAYQYENQQNTCQDLLPVWDGEVDPTLNKADGLGKSLPNGKMPKSGKRKSDIERQITRIKSKITQIEKKQDREAARKKRKAYQQCMKNLSGRFLCNGSNKYFCGNRCGWHPACKCCYYPQAARRRMCK